MRSTVSAVVKWMAPRLGDVWRGGRTSIAADPDDCDGDGGGDDSAVIGDPVRARMMLQPLAIAVIGGILASMVLSLLVTPAVFYLGERE